MEPGTEGLELPVDEQVQWSVSRVVRPYASPSLGLFRKRAKPVETINGPKSLNFSAFAKAGERGKTGFWRKGWDEAPA